RQHLLFAGARQEGAGTGHAAGRVARAHQRLGAGEPHGLEIDLGLVELLEPAALQHHGKGDLAVVRLRLSRKQVAQDFQHRTPANHAARFRAPGMAVLQIMPSNQGNTVNESGPALHHALQMVTAVDHVQINARKTRSAPSNSEPAKNEMRNTRGDTRIRNHCPSAMPMAAGTSASNEAPATPVGSAPSATRTAANAKVDTVNEMPIASTRLCFSSPIACR